MQGEIYRLREEIHRFRQGIREKSGIYWVLLASARGEWQIALMEDSRLRHQIKELMVEKLMLQMAPEEIGETTALFGPEGLGLDSIDALELVVGLEKSFGISIQNSEVAAEVLQNISSIADYVKEHGDVTPKTDPSGK